MKLSSVLIGTGVVMVAAGALWWRKKASAQEPGLPPDVSTKPTLIWEFKDDSADAAVFGEKLAAHRQEIDAVAAACLPRGRFVGWSSRELGAGESTISMVFEYDAPALTGEAASAALRCIDKSL